MEHEDGCCSQFRNCRSDPSWGCPDFDDSTLFDCSDEESIPDYDAPYTPVQDCSFYFAYFEPGPVLGPVCEA